jgi:hypothetical protein
MTDTPMPHEIERLAGNAAYAARHGSSPKLNTAPPLSGVELARKQAVYRKAHGLLKQETST